MYVTLLRIYIELSLTKLIYIHTREIDLAQQYNIPPLFSKKEKEKEKEKEKGTSQFNDFV